MTFVHLIATLIVGILALVMGFAVGRRERWRSRQTVPKRTAYLVAKVKQIPEYPYFAIEDIETFSDPCPTMKLSLMPVTVLETDGDDYGQAKAHLIEEMMARRIPAKNAVDKPRLDPRLIT